VLYYINPFIPPAYSGKKCSSRHDKHFSNGKLVFLPGFQKDREQFWSKKGNLRRSTEKRQKLFKTYRISLLVGSISFTHLRQFRWLPDGASIIMTNKK
jgi:hypothetical protein